MDMSDVYQQMTDRIMLTGSKLIPELFRMVVDPDEARLLLAMPGTPEELAKRVERTPADVERMCRTLYQKGVAFKSFKGGSLGYKMCANLIQFHDATILWSEATPEFYSLWQRFMEAEWPDLARRLVKAGRKPMTRVIPVQQSIETGRQQVLDADSVERIIGSADALAVTRCTCRVIAHKCDRPVEVCLQVNNAARYTIDRGSGRSVTREEALSILRECEKQGLVHVTMNKAHVGHFICNCCPCCCQTLPLMIAEGLRISDPSRFQAEIDPAVCTLCETCRDRCHFNALEVSPEAGENGHPVMRVIAEKCMGCGLCHDTCPEGAIFLKEVREIAFIPG
jgi:formate hydrogenlyase subunit 6/NADH:ubiquinone oxidoreductase subunit I